MKKFVTFLISAILLLTGVHLSAQTEKKQTDGCYFRFVLESPLGFGWSDSYGIEVTVDGIDFGIVRLPWGTPSAEETLRLPSGEVHFSWISGPLGGPEHYFEIYNSFDELIFTSPDFHPTGLLFTYQNKCPECIPLTHFEGEYNQEAKVVNLSWVVPESEYVTGFDIFRNGEWIDHVDSTVNSYSSQTDTLETGDYKYCVVPIYPYICTLEEKCFETYINNVGIKNYSFDIQLYPNPARNELHVQSSKFKVQSIEFYDIFGRKLYEYNNSYGLMVLRSYGLTTDGVVINISHLPSGIYFVKIFTDQGEVVKKFIKQ